MFFGYILGFIFVRPRFHLCHDFFYFLPFFYFLFCFVFSLFPFHFLFLPSSSSFTARNLKQCPTLSSQVFYPRCLPLSHDIFGQELTLFFLLFPRRFLD